MKIEQDNETTFLDILLMHNVETVNTTVYRKVIFTSTGNLSLLITGNGGL